jgi:hypothetical protein
MTWILKSEAAETLTYVDGRELSSSTTSTTEFDPGDAQDPIGDNCGPVPRWLISDVLAGTSQGVCSLVSPEFAL